MRRKRREKSTTRHLIGWISANPTVLDELVAMVTATPPIMI
jgi:hypothetical protein